MIQVRFHIVLGVALAFFAGACSKNAEPSAGSSGSITLTFLTGEMQTRSGTVGDGSVLDGGGIYVDNNGNPDLAVAIVNRYGNIVAWYPKDYGEVGEVIDYSADKITQLAANTPATETVINITGPERGTYSVFVVANTAGLGSDLVTALKNSTTLSALEALTLSASGSEPPAFTTAMPLSARGSLSVNSSGDGQADLELKRPVAKVSLYFRNNTDTSLSLSDCSVTIYTINPTSGYLFASDPDYVSGGDRNLVLSDNTNPFTVPVIDPNNTESDNTYELPAKLVFPSVAPAQAIGSRYLCDISFTIGSTPYSFTGLPVHDRKSADIVSLLRNQHLKIETRISKRAAEHDISFNFEVADWDDSENFVFFH